MISLRPKFSLRLVLLAIAVASVTLCIFITRPTMLANQFAVAIEQQDFAAARALMVDAVEWDTLFNPPESNKADRVLVELMPHEWQDALAGQRRLKVIVERHTNHDGAFVDWAESTEIIARAHGLKIESSHFPRGIAAELPPGPPRPFPKRSPSLSAN